MTSSLDRFIHFVNEHDDAAAESAVVDLSPADEAKILARLTTTQDAELRWWLTRALAQCGSPDAYAVLDELLRNGDAAQRATAVLALGHISRRTPQAVPACDAMAALLQDREGVVRQAAADALALVGDPAVPALTAALESDHEGARSRAMAALRKIASFAAAKPMFQYLNDENYLVRTYAYEGLDEMGLLDNVLLQI